MADQEHAIVKVQKIYEEPPEKVFDAWLDSGSIEKWLLSTDKEILKIAIDSRVGGKFCFSVRRDGQVIDHIGKYLRMDPPRLLVFTWGVPFYSKESSTVTLTLEPVGNGTKVTLTHENVLNEYEMATSSGWTRILAALETAIKS